MQRKKPRTRREIAPDHVPTLKALGFRYSPGRDAYVLRLIGNQVGPVYRTRAQPAAAADSADAAHS